jgi:[ribosomal protein S5]-alanine N-acetyltransferase
VGTGTALTEIRTERLRLAPMTLADSARVVGLYVDPRVNRHSPSGAPTAAESRRRVRESVAAWARDGIGYWIVEHEGRLAGVTGVRPTELRGATYWNVFYRFAPETWGRGIASEAVRAVLQAAREQVPGRHFAARTRPGNQAAIRLAEAVGLTRARELDSDGFVTYAGP